MGNEPRSAASASNSSLLIWTRAVSEPRFITSKWSAVSATTS